MALNGISSFLWVVRVKKKNPGSDPARNSHPPYGRGVSPSLIRPDRRNSGCAAGPHKRPPWPEVLHRRRGRLAPLAHQLVGDGPFEVPLHRRRGVLAVTALGRACSRARTPDALQRQGGFRRGLNTRRRLNVVWGGTRCGQTFSRGGHLG